MSHAVTITRTTTPTTALVVNTEYFKTLPGILRLVQVILGIVCDGVTVPYASQQSDYHTTVPMLFLLLTLTFLVGSVCIILSSLILQSTESSELKTLCVLLYHGAAFIVLLAASLKLLIEVNNMEYKSGYYESFTAASVMGMVNSALYLQSTFFGYSCYCKISKASVCINRPPTTVKEMMENTKECLQIILNHPDFVKK